MRAIDTETTMSPAMDARGYVKNAEETLAKKAKLNLDYQSYEDKKYVRSAGHFLWNAVLIMLEAEYHLKKNKRSRVDVDDYKALLARDDRKLLSMVNNAYDIMHLSMGYDGILKKSVCQEGINLAYEIIERCEKRLK